MEHVILVGMMGVGKTTVGRIVSQLTARNFIDTDYFIEKQEGMSVSDIITLKGEDCFRKIERNVILSFRLKTSSVVSAGGGAVMDNDIFLFLKKTGKLVYLKASPESLYKRTANIGSRPLLRHGNRLEIIRALLQTRESRYMESDIVIESDKRSPINIAEDIVERLHL